LSNLETRWVVLGPALEAAEVQVTPTVFEDLHRHFEGFRGRVLVSMYSFESDWPTWECHPHGDEVVVLLEGSAEMVLEKAGAHESVRLAKAGDYVVVPKGTWHTARISASARMLFVTPGEGTQNRAAP
jgi:mannose-6-phosphate isomerase-like protein (cupin superfamily)